MDDKNHNNGKSYKRPFLIFFLHLSGCYEILLLFLQRPILCHIEFMTMYTTATLLCPHPTPLGIVPNNNIFRGSHFQGPKTTHAHVADIFFWFLPTKICPQHIPGHKGRDSTTQCDQKIIQEIQAILSWRAKLSQVASDKHQKGLY